MSARNKGIFLVLLLLGLNIGIIHSTIPPSNLIGIASEADSLETAIDVSVPAVGADFVWFNYQDDNKDALTGKDILIGIVDTGIDCREQGGTHHSQ